MYPSLGGVRASSPPAAPARNGVFEYSRLLSSLRHPCALLIALAATSDGNAVIKPDITVNSRALG